MELSIETACNEEFDATGYSLRDDYDGTGAEEAIAVLEALNAPAGQSECAVELGRLTVLTKARSEDRDDTKFRLGVLADELASYPLDVVRGACRHWTKYRTFFPAWAELRALCEERVLKRRCLLSALERYWRAA